MLRSLRERGAEVLATGGCGGHTCGTVVIRLFVRSCGVQGLLIGRGSRAYPVSLRLFGQIKFEKPSYWTR